MFLNRKIIPNIILLICLLPESYYAQSPIQAFVAEYGYMRPIRDHILVNDTILKVRVDPYEKEGDDYYYYRLPEKRLIKVSSNRDEFKALEYQAKKNIQTVIISKEEVKSPDLKWQGLKRTLVVNESYTINITNNETGDDYLIDTLSGDYTQFQMGFCRNGKYFYYVGRNGFKVVALDGMQEVYSLPIALDNLSFSHDNKYALLSYVDYKGQKTNLILQTSNWQIFTKMNFGTYGSFYRDNNSLYLTKYVSEREGYSPYRLVFVTADLDIMEKLAVENRLQLEYALNDIAYVPSFEDRGRGLQFSPMRNFLLMGNVLYNAKTAAYINEVPTPNVFGLDMSFEFSNDEKYLKVTDLKYNVNLFKLELTLDTIAVREYSLPDFKAMTAGKLSGNYEGVKDAATSAFMFRFSKELQSEIIPTTSSDYKNVRLSADGKKLYACRAIYKDKNYDFGYFTGKVDQFKKICDNYKFKNTKEDSGPSPVIGFNSTTTRAILVTTNKSQTVLNIKVINLETDKVEKQTEIVAEHWGENYFSSDDGNSFFCLKADSIYKMDTDGKVISVCKYDNLSMYSKPVNQILYDQGSIWVSSGKPDYSLCKINPQTGKTELNFIWPIGVDKLNEFVYKSDAKVKAESARNEELKIREANKFDAKKYKQKIKQERKEANAKLTEAIYNAAAKKPVYESCSDCGGTGKTRYFEIKYTREVSGSWGYSSNYTLFSNHITTTTKCSTCGGTGKAICYRASCYDLSQNDINK
jgi:hypothetical protein